MNLQEKKFRSESEVEEVLKALVANRYCEDTLDELDGYGGLKQWLREGEDGEPFSVEDALGYASQCA